MHAWETIDQSLNYIEEHLSGEISTEELADMVGLSQFYYQRLFKRLVRNGHGPGVCETPPFGKSG